MRPVSQLDPPRTRTRTLVGALGGLAALATAFVWNEQQLGESATAHAISHFTALAAPSVLNVAALSRWPYATQLTFAVQWLCCPVYLLAFTLAMPPAGRHFRELCQERYNSLPTRFGYGYLIGSIAILGIVLSDLGIISGPSPMRGTLFTLAPNDWLLGLPYHSRVGLALAAFVSSYFVAWSYWLIIGVSFNITRLWGLIWK